MAAQGFNTVFAVHLASSFGDIAEMLGEYRREFAAHAPRPVEPPKAGFSLHVHVAETDEQALAQARPAFAAFMHNFTHRYVVRHEPERLARYAERMDFDGEIARGRLLVGSPATVREQLGRMLRQSGANYFLGAFFFGSLTLPQAVRSLELFAREVSPSLSK